ncbi:MAG TPA: hypothetical protein VIG66_05295, partial [Noviherbaspirillum sp.]
MELDESSNHSLKISRVASHDNASSSILLPLHQVRFMKIPDLLNPLPRLRDIGPHPDDNVLPPLSPLSPSGSQSLPRQQPTIYSASTGRNLHHPTLLNARRTGQSSPHGEVLATGPSVAESAHANAGSARSSHPSLLSLNPDERKAAEIALENELLKAALIALSSNGYEDAEKQAESVLNGAKPLPTGVSKLKDGKGFKAKNGSIQLGSFSIDPHDEKQALTLAIALRNTKLKTEELVPQDKFIAETDKKIREIVGEEIWG